MKIGGSRTRKRSVNVRYPSKSLNDAPFLFIFLGLGFAVYFLFTTYGRQFKKPVKNSRTHC